MEAELAADAARTEEAVLQHLEGLLGDRDSARLCLCKQEVHDLFRGLQVGGKGPAVLPPCPELQDTLGPAVVSELRRVLGGLHKSLSEARVTPGQAAQPSDVDKTKHADPRATRQDAWDENEESSHDTLHSPGGSPDAAGSVTPPDTHLLRCEC